WSLITNGEAYVACGFLHFSSAGNIIGLSTSEQAPVDPGWQRNIFISDPQNEIADWLGTYASSVPFVRLSHCGASDEGAIAYIDDIYIRRSIERIVLDDNAATELDQSYTDASTTVTAGTTGTVQSVTVVIDDAQEGGPWPVTIQASFKNNDSADADL